ncbi:MAG: energy transducer TonB [Verrucomicrobia bacterium]|nr:energy transducer TonB [Verrucomicrobiota bacterium]
MRKVYQGSSSQAGLWISGLCAVAGTAAIFMVLPFTHVVARPDRHLELRKTSATDLPPPVEEEPPPPQQQEQAQEEVPPPPTMDDAPQQVPLMADLDVAVGGGGFLPGFMASGQGGPADQAEAVAETFSAAELEERPQAVARTDPAYPNEMRKARVEGAVTLALVVDESGRVEEARIEKSSHPDFEKPALEAIRKWRFRPGMKDGQAVRAYLMQTFRFRPPAS